ncbi:MAG: class I SAM-dependent methyltransferase [Spirochaetales bacterium]|jgi:SAM-dependent methyltransferase|nr:class I SAM-dependent methyltransferase [Spirochaetales bacterium]
MEKTYSSVPAGAERMAPIVCPVCGESKTSPYWDCGDFLIKKCRGCGHLYQNPQPVFGDLKNRYQDSYFDYEISNEEAFFRLMLLGLEDVGFPEWEEKLKTAGAFLDIGCATGCLLASMQGRGWKVQGVEICDPSAQYGIKKRGVPVFIGPLEDAPFPPASFSLVHFSHLIEHVPDPRRLLARVYELLVPGGAAIIVTPNRAGFQARLLKKKWRSCIADHLNLFDKKGLGRIIGETGFSIVKTQTWGGIAAGLAPAFIKKPLDRMAKKFGFGDVMLFHVHKAGT